MLYTFTLDVQLADFTHPLQPAQAKRPNDRPEHPIQLSGENHVSIPPLSVYSQEQLDMMAEELNDRPRKTLNFLSPSQKISVVLQ